MLPACSQGSSQLRPITPLPALYFGEGSNDCVIGAHIPSDRGLLRFQPKATLTLFSSRDAEIYYECMAHDMTKRSVCDVSH